MRKRVRIAAALAHAPGHAQPHDAHGLIGCDDACLHVTEALEDQAFCAAACGQQSPAFGRYLDAVDRAAAGAAVEAANADTALMSWTDMLVTIGFMSSAHGPRRAPVFMSKSCRMV